MPASTLDEARRSRPTLVWLWVGGVIVSGVALAVILKQNDDLNR